MNKEFKGTKGEWRVIQSMDSRTIIGTDEFSLVDAWYDMGVEFETKEKGLANAKLIAAAPELLELCLLVHHSFGGGNVITFNEKDIEDFKNAINKALN